MKYSLLCCRIIKTFIHAFVLVWSPTCSVLLVSPTFYLIVLLQDRVTDEDKRPFRVIITSFARCIQWMLQQNMRIFTSNQQFIGKQLGPMRGFLWHYNVTVFSQQIVLFSSTKQTAPVLLPMSYFSMPVSSFTLTLSPACVWNRAEPNFPFPALSRISDQDQYISDKPFHSWKV